VRRLTQVLVVLAIAILVTAGLSTVATAQSPGSVTPGQHVLNVGGKHVAINVELKNSKYTVSTDYPLDGPDSASVVAALESYVDALNSTASTTGPVVQTLGYGSGWDQWMAYAYAYDASHQARCYSYTNVKFNHPSFWTVDLHAFGKVSGSWYGSGTPTYIILSEKLSVSASGSINYTWPPGFTPDGGGSRSYTSEPFYNTTYASSPYSGMYAKSRAAIYSYTQSDGSIVRVNNTDYRQYSSIYTSWLFMQCTTSPTGSYTHTHS